MLTYSFLISVQALRVCLFLFFRLIVFYLCFLTHGHSPSLAQNTQTNKQTNKPTNKQTNKPTNTFFLFLSFAHPFLDQLFHECPGTLLLLSLYYVYFLTSDLHHFVISLIGDPIFIFNIIWDSTTTICTFSFLPCCLKPWLHSFSSSTTYRYIYSASFPTDQQP